MKPSRRGILFWIWLMMVVAYVDRVNIAVAGPAIMKALHLTPSAFGWVLSAFTLGYALMQIPGGYLADRFGSRPLLITAMVLWSLFTGLTGLAESFAALIAIRILFGVGEGLENGPQFKLIGDYFDSRERSSANALFLTALAIGPALASPLTASLLTRVGWHGVFFCFAVPGIIVAALLALFLPRPGQVPLTEDRSAANGTLAESLGDPNAWLLFATYLFFNVAFWGFLGWMPGYLNLSRHIKLADLGWPASLPYLFGFLGLIAMGRLGSRTLFRHRALLIGVGYLLAAAFLYVAFTSARVEWCVGGLSIAGFFLYGGFGPFWAISLDLIPAHSRGAFAGFVNFGGQIGGFCAPIVIGHIVESTRSFSGGFLFMIAALALSSLCLFTLQLRGRTSAPAV